MPGLRLPLSTDLQEFYDWEESFDRVPAEGDAPKAAQAKPISLVVWK